MTTLLVESVLRSLLMAAMVWAGIKLLRVRHVLAQKIAWGLVLLVAFAMPQLIRWQAAHPQMALVVPLKQTRAVAAIERSISAIRIDRVANAGPSTPSSHAAPSGTRAYEPISAPTVALPAVSLTQLEQAPARVWHASDLVRFVIPAYLAIGAVLLFRLFFGLALAMRIWHRAEPASPILEPRATVRISESIQSPVTIGSGIVLPANYTEWDRCKLRLVLAHERAHVCQGDFYLQMLASLYAALVWFSPLGWWLKHRLAELGEAVSDRAALLEADDSSSYAEVLLEFAALPRHNFAGVAAGVGMARSSNIQRRIERILSDNHLRSAFASGRRHAVIAALLVPCGLILATSLLHVQAAEAVKAKAIAVLQTVQNQTQEIAPPSTIARQAPRSNPPLLAPAPVARVSAPVQLQPVPPVAEIAMPSPLLAIHAPEAPIPVVLGPEAPGVLAFSQDSDQESELNQGEHFVIVDRDRNFAYSHNGSWGYGAEADRVGKKVKGNFIWFERDGKSYVITDPALLAQVKSLYAPQGELGRRQAELGRQQAELGKQQGLLGVQQAMVQVPLPDISKQMAELQKSVQRLAAEQAEQVTQERLAELQAQLGALQGRLAAAQTLAGSKQSVLGSQQGELGAKQAELGRQQAELGREQERIAREATQQVRALIDQAFRDGKAKPVE